jgi:hypothetical protein
VSEPRKERIGEEGGRCFIAYEDDASRFIVGFGVYDNPNLRALC